MTKRPDNLTMAVFACVILIGGGNAVGIRLSNRELAPLWGGSLRFVLASAIFFVLIAALRLSLPRGKALLGMLIYGLVGGTLVSGWFISG